MFETRKPVRGNDETRLRDAGGRWEEMPAALPGHRPLAEESIAALVRRGRRIGPQLHWKFVIVYTGVS